MMNLRPFLKWPGNKYRCLSHILPILPPSTRLIEPFTGSGAIFINSNYSHYLLAEQNIDLIHLFSFLKEEGEIFIDYCKQFFNQVNNCKEKYYRLREEFNSSQNIRKRAAIFLYLNRHGYNGLCRYNLRGIYNVPFGRYEKPYFPLVEMRHFHKKSQQATFIHGDFRHTFTQARPGDIIYCDPPYVPRTQQISFNTYTAKPFKEQDQIELAHLATESAKKDITVIISNHDTPFTRLHYKNAFIVSFTVKRSISCLANKRCHVNELLAIFSNESYANQLKDHYS